MKYKVYLDELEAKSQELINYSKNEISNKIEELSVLVDEINWEGEARNIYLEGYKSRIAKINKLNEHIELFGEYLKFCKEHYGETSAKLNEMWKDFLDELRRKYELFER